MSEIELKFQKFFVSWAENKFIKQTKFNANRGNLGKKERNLNKEIKNLVKRRKI